MKALSLGNGLGVVDTVTDGELVCEDAFAYGSDFTVIICLAVADAEITITQACYQTGVPLRERAGAVKRARHVVARHVR